MLWLGKSCIKNPSPCPPPPKKREKNLVVPVLTKVFLATKPLKYIFEIQCWRFLNEYKLRWFDIIISCLGDLDNIAHQSTDLYVPMELTWARGSRTKWMTFRLGYRWRRVSTCIIGTRIVLMVLNFDLWHASCSWTAQIWAANFFWIFWPVLFT